MGETSGLSRQTSDIRQSRTPLTEGEIETWGKEGPGNTSEHTGDTLPPGLGRGPSAWLVYAAPRMCEDILPVKGYYKIRSMHHGLLILHCHGCLKHLPLLATPGCAQSDNRQSCVLC